MTSALRLLHLFGEVSIPGDPLVAALTQKETQQLLQHSITDHFLKGFGFSLEGTCACTVLPGTKGINSWAGQFFLTNMLMSSYINKGQLYE